MTENALPIACTLQPGEIEKRRAGLLPGLLRSAMSCSPIEGGYRLAFNGGTPVVDIARVVDAERRCCQFLRFELTIEPGLGSMRLDVTGPPGTSEFLASLLDT